MADLADQLSESKYAQVTFWCFYDNVDSNENQTRQWPVAAVHFYFASLPTVDGTSRMRTSTEGYE